MINFKLPVLLKNICTGLAILLFVFAFFPNTGFGQKNEIGIFFGGSYYLGDLNPHKQFALTRIALGGLYRHNFTPHFSLRANGIFGSVEGNDALIKYNQDRNLRFVSRVNEISAQAEVNFLPFVAGNLQTPYSPFLFWGAGAIFFNPQAQDEQGNWRELRPLRTEGQTEESQYGPISTSFVLGFGLKFNISRNISGGVEWGMRRTGTDYLDDVSTTYANLNDLPGGTSRYFADRSLSNPGQNTGLQRGNPRNNDWYSFAGFVIAFKIKDFKRSTCPAFN